MYNGYLVPNSMLINTKESLSWLSYMDARTSLVMCYLFDNQLRSNNIVKFTLNDLIINCGYKPNRSLNGNNDKFKEILNNLLLIGAIESDYNIIKVKPNELIVATYKALTVIEEGYSNYAYIGLNEYNKIMNSNYSITQRIGLLNVYLYISARTETKDKDFSLAAFGGRAQCCWFTYETISEDINTNSTSFNNYISILKDELKLIDYGNVGKLKHPKGNIINGCNTYVMTSCNEYKYNLSEGLKQSRLYYENMGYTIHI